MQGQKRLGVAAAVVAALTLASQAHAGCSFGSSGGEPSLQSSFDALLGSGAPSVTTACVPDGADAAWSTVGTTGAASILIELAGNASSNGFGIYDLANPNHRLSVFEGDDAVSAFATIRLAPLASGGWRVSVREVNTPTDPIGWTSMNIATSAFGFYLSTSTQGSFFSNTALNTDGTDHMYAYRGANAEFVGGPLEGEVFGQQDFMLAWEDLRAPGTDRDYQDFVAVVQDVTPVPLPTALWLLASGMVGLVGVARRKA